MGIIAALTNLWFFGFLLLVEYQLGSSGCIPRRNNRHDPARPQESFLYMLDRDMFRIGDVVGLSILAFAIGSIISQKGFPPLWYMIIASVVSIVHTVWMHYKVWLVQRKRDSAYPPEGVSLLGIAHLPYYAGHVIWGFMGLWHIPNPGVLGFSLLGLLGVAIWKIAIFRDGRLKKHL